MYHFSLESDSDVHQIDIAVTRFNSSLIRTQSFLEHIVLRQL